MSGESQGTIRQASSGPIESLAPGEELAGLLERIDPSDLNGHQLVTYLQAIWRQRAHLDSLAYRAIFELAHTPPCDPDDPPERTQVPDEFVADELAAALRLTNRASHLHLNLAFSLARLPAVMAALLAGRIDAARARVICDETVELDDDAAREMAGWILGPAPELTTSQIGRRLRHRIMSEFPDAARKRHRRGLEERRVEARPNPDGTADLSGGSCRWACRPDHGPNRRDLRRLKRWRPPPIDQIRADVYCDLLEGRHLHSPGDRGREDHGGSRHVVGLADEPGSWTAGAR